VEYCLNNLCVKVVILPPQYVYTGEWFFLPVVVRTSDRPLKLSASVSINERLSA
jgi:hypothetical protein